MLTRNPLKRPQMSQVLAHPFLSGKKATRLFGEVAEFDVFLSYRKQSDENHAQLMYTKLTDAGLKVWWDKKSLMPGVPWQVCMYVPHLFSHSRFSLPCIYRKDSVMVWRRVWCFYLSSLGKRSTALQWKSRISHCYLDRRIATMFYWSIDWL